MGWEFKLKTSIVYQNESSPSQSQNKIQNKSKQSHRRKGNNDDTNITTKDTLPSHKSAPLHKETHQFAAENKIPQSTKVHQHKNMHPRLTISVKPEYAYPP